MSITVLAIALILVTVGVVLTVCVCKTSAKGNCDRCGQYSDHLYNWPDDSVCSVCDKERMDDNT
ncbi:hypothetical protein VPHD148_0033 [Vibrio phage D148]